MTEDLGSDLRDGGTDHSSRARSTGTTKVRECGGDGLPACFVGGVAVWAMLSASDVLA